MNNQRKKSKNNKITILNNTYFIGLMPQHHPIITIIIGIMGIIIIAFISSLIMYIFVELIDNLCYKPCCKKWYIRCKDKKNGVKVAPEIKIVEAKITILPVTVYAREIIISDACEV